MTLAAGTRLGPYEILAPLGAGGMGEVYRAKDTRLSRDVAIKVLPQHLSASPDIRARFEREAKTVSSLNHPHICVLHDVGREGDTDYLVMELVEGETLAQRLTRGPLPMPEVLKLGSQIADALDRAHRAGVIHRDLKPGNVMLTRSGAKLMDFGLARATGLVGPPGSSGATFAALTQSPTVATPLTAEGALIGTFQYMAPEQLEGREADARSDLWSFGAMLYEMATGRHAFEGRSQASLIAAILEREPAAISTVAPLTPPALERLIRACLAKDPEQRIQTAHDVKLQLDWIAEGGSMAGVPAPVAIRRRSRERLAWIVGALFALATVALASVLLLRRPTPVESVQFEVMAPKGAVNIQWPRLSPDGRRLAMLVNDTTGTPWIWIRPLASTEAHPVPGTQGASRPFWSPDSRYLGFIVDGKLKKIPVDGGPAVTAADAPGGADGSWGADLVLFDGSGQDSIRAVPASGGAVRPASYKDRSAQENQHSWPFFLPDGKHFLYISALAGQNDGTMKVGELGSTRSHGLGTTSGRVEYANGYLFFPREGTLMAQPFDLGSLKTTGDPVPIGERLSVGTASGHFSVTDRLLAFRVEDSGGSSQVMWVDRAGRQLSIAAPPAVYRDLALSPDDRRLAVGISAEGSGQEDIWIRDLARGISSRITFGGGANIWPTWSPDGQRVAYCTNRSGDFRVLIRSAGGEGGEDSLGHINGGQEGPSDWSRDGRTIAISRFGDASWDVVMAALEGDRTPKSWLQTRYSERDPVFSPDGRWLAYGSNESGRPEVYVASYPGPGGKWQISNAGGVEPHWRGDGKELYYRAADGTLMAVPVQAGATFDMGTPVPLFKLVLALGAFNRSRWLPSHDGQRFLLNQPLSNASAGKFVVIENWAETLKKTK